MWNLTCQLTSQSSAQDDAFAHTDALSQKPTKIGDKMKTTHQLVTELQERLEFILITKNMYQDENFIEAAAKASDALEIFNKFLG
jgi:hypothetical protein